MNITDAVRNTFNFEVEKLPLTGPGGLPSPFFTMYRTDTREQVGGAVKETYEPHTVDDVCVLTEAASSVFDSTGVSVECYWNGYAHEVLVSPGDAYRESIAGDKDAVWPRVHIRAGYNGTSFRAGLGLYRDICDNLMLPKQMSGTSASIFHTSNLRPRIDQLAEQFARLASHWDSMIETFKELHTRVVDFDKFVERVFGIGLKPSDEGIELTGRAQRRADALIRRLTSERQALGQRDWTRDVRSGNSVTAWEALATIQGYCQHDAVRRGSLTRQDRAFIALEDQRVAAAFSLALAL